MRALVKLKYIGLVNLVLGEKTGAKPVVQEFIQPSYSDQVDIMVELNKIEIVIILYRDELIGHFREIKEKLSAKSKKQVEAGYR